MSRILGRGAVLDPDIEVVTQQADGTHRQTLKQTWDRANRVAHALKNHGIEVGDRIGSFMWNNYYHLELYQGVPSMGAVLHTLNIRLSPADLEYIINHANGYFGTEINTPSTSRTLIRIYFDHTSPLFLVFISKHMPDLFVIINL